jgi:hypothetical protein
MTSFPSSRWFCPTHLAGYDAAVCEVAHLQLEKFWTRQGNPVRPLGSRMVRKARGPPANAAQADRGWGTDSRRPMEQESPRKGLLCEGLPTTRPPDRGKMI